MTLDSNQTEEQLLSTVQQEYKILAEYKMVESEKLSGIYVIPSYENSKIWFGVLFVRSGIYNGAIFRFNILLPDNFPDDKILPSVVFQNEIFHPLVCPYTGTCDLSFAFQEWRKGVDHVWHILKLVQLLFADVTEASKFTNKYSNPEAADLMTNNFGKFSEKAVESMSLSKEKIYDPPSSHDPHYIAFESFQEDIHRSVIEKILQKKDIIEKPNVPSHLGLSWVKEGEFKALSKEDL
ncbi:AKTIP family protein [Megaselia abdita]